MAVIISSTDCVLPRPDLSDLHSQLATEFSKRLLGGAPVLPMSTEDVLSFVMAGAVNLMFGAVTQALKENDPSTMCCDNLVIYGAGHGIDLRAATRAKGYIALTGTPNAPIPGIIRLVGESSREYKLDPGVTTNPVALNDSGTASVRVVATVGGSAFNLAVGSAVTVSTTIPGIDMEATVVGNGLTGGTDDETCEALRARIIAAEQADVIVTNEQWYLRETMAYPGVTRACTDDCVGCCNPEFTAIYPFMEGVYGDVTTAPYGVPPTEVLDEMTAWMFGQQIGLGQGLAPIGVRGAYQTAYPTVVSVSAQCFTGCPLGAVDRIRTALWTHIRASFCVGSTICKDQMRAAIYATLGPDPCMSDVQLHFDDTLGNEDDANAYLACGRFLVLGDIELREGYR